MKIYLPFVLLLICFPIFGQTQQLTYQEAIQIALRENIDARTQANELEVRKAEQLQGYAAFLPTADLAINTERAAGNQFIPEFDQLINTVSESFWGQVGADIDLFRGFSRINTLKRNKLRIASQEHLIQRTKQDVAFQVTSQYLQILLDEELLTIAEDNLATQREVLANITELVENGLRGIPEQYVQEAEVSRLETMVIERQNTLINDKATLAQTLQLDPTEDFTLEAPGWSPEQIYAQAYQLETLYQTANQTRPDLQQAITDVDAAAYDTKIAKAQYLPSLSAYYRYRSFWNSANNMRNFSEQFGEDNVRKTLGATLFIPIFGGLSNRTQYIRTKVQYENARLTQQNMQKTIQIDVKNAYQNWIAAKNNWDAAQTQFEVAQRSYQAQKELYENGLNRMMDLARSNNGFVVAQANKAQAHYTLLFQAIMLEYATGELNPQALSLEK